MRALLFCTAISLAACGGRQAPATGTAIAVEDTIAAGKQQGLQVPLTTEDSFSNFYNAVMVEYCVPLPAGWREDPAAATVKAKHVFVKGEEDATVITVQGLLRSDTSVSLLQYYLNTYNEAAEAAGKIVEVKQLKTSKNCFYAYGYFNNDYYKSRFMEITWLRPNEAVVYTIQMPVADTVCWYKRLNRLLNHTAACK